MTCMCAIYIRLSLPYNCPVHEPEPTACPNGDEECPESYLCAECHSDGMDQAAIDAEDARQGR